MEILDVQDRLFDNLPGSPSYPADTNMETMENVSKMDKEELRKLRTECALAEKGEDLSQLVDRIASNNFQG